MGTEGTLSSVWDQHAGTVGVPGCACRSSGTHFARQFKAATSLPPHQFVIARRVERAKQLLQAGTDLSLAEVAAHAGFSDQSQFSHHFKRIVGLTPRQFRRSFWPQEQPR